MEFSKQTDALTRMKELLATQIKLDVARTVRHHPHLTGEAAANAYASLTDEHTINQMVAELAREAISEAVARGETPPASWLHLANYKLSTSPKGIA